jgi:hypothetical protein
MHEQIHDSYLQHISKPAVDAEGRKQGSIDDYIVANHETHYGAANPCQRALTTSLVFNVIVKCNMPISLVDNIHFRQFLSDIYPHFNPLCRQTVTSSILPQLSLQKSEFKSILENCSDVSLTTEIWTDRQAHAFLAVTFHVFNDGAPLSGLLAFCSFPGSQTGDRIAEALDAVISEFGIENKIRTVVTDNASNMRKALSVLLSVSMVLCLIILMGIKCGCSY